MHIKHILYTIIILAIIYSCSKNEDTKTENNTAIEEKMYIGSLINPTGTELQEFYNNNYNVISGDVRFEENTELVNMIAFSNITRIEGSIFLKNNPNLKTLKGFNNLLEIGGDFYFHGLKYEELENMDDFNKIKTIGGELHIANAYYVPNLDNFSNLEYIGGDIFLFWIKYLTNVDFLSKITKINGNLYIDWAANYESLSGLSNITVVSGDLYIGQSNDQDPLPTLTPLSNMKSIEGDLTINGIPASYCGLMEIIINGGVNGNIYFSELGDFNSSQFQYYFSNCDKKTMESNLIFNPRNY